MSEKLRDSLEDAMITETTTLSGDSIQDSDYLIGDFELKIPVTTTSREKYKPGLREFLSAGYTTAYATIDEAAFKEAVDRYFKTTYSTGTDPYNEKVYTAPDLEPATYKQEWEENKYLNKLISTLIFKKVLYE